MLDPCGATLLIWPRMRRQAGAAILIVAAIAATSTPSATAQVFPRGAVTPQASVAAHVVWAARTASTAQKENYSTTIALVNLATVSNTVTLDYYRPDGTTWAPSETATLGGYGDVLQRYPASSSDVWGEGSIAATGQAALGTDVYIRTYSVPWATSAYSAVPGGAARMFVPAVFKRSELSLPAHAAAPPWAAAANSLYLPLLNGHTVSSLEMANSQIVVQNTGVTTATVTISLYGGQGTRVYAAAPRILPPKAAFRYDLLADGSAPEGAFSAVVEAPGGQVAVLTMIRLGPVSMMSYTGASDAKTVWYLPMFAARLDDGQSAEIVVQNAGPEPLPPGALTIDCRPDAASPVTTGFVWTNPQAIPSLTSVAFDGAAAPEAPAGFWGHCRVQAHTPVYPVLLVRSIAGSEAGAYEGLAGDGQDTHLVMPFYGKRLAGGNSTAVAIQNLGVEPAVVTLRYLAFEATDVSCSATLERTIPGESTLVQDHRVTDGPDAVTELGSQCFGKLLVAANQPIAGVTLVTNLNIMSSDDTALVRLIGAP